MNSVIFWFATGVREDLADAAGSRQGRFPASGVVPEGLQRGASNHDTATHIQVNAYLTFGCSFGV